MKRRSGYSNTKVKTRNLLTNVSYRRFKKSDFPKNNFIIDIVSFLVQNFDPVNLDIKLDTDKERETVEFLWGECILVEFVQFIYKHKYFTQINQPSLTYQKANTIVKEYLIEDQNRINQLKFKIEEKFELIHCIYSLLFSKIYNRKNTFGIQKKNNFEFHFDLWKTKKNQKIYKLMLYKATAKDPSNYEEREIEKNEQAPIDISISKEVVRPTMAKITTKKREEKRKHLENKLNENTEMMKKLKKNYKIVNFKVF